jgi:excisionase family DNA binding protein
MKNSIDNITNERPENKIHVPINQKLLLSIREAAEYSGIGINKINDMLRAPNCPYVLYVGVKKLVKREAFEEFLKNQLTI